MSRHTRSADPLRAVAYVRVSTDEQQLGPDAQRRAIEGWAVANAVTIVSWHVEHVTGAADIEARPALTEALGSLRPSAAGVLVVAKRDRLARDSYVAMGIERAAGRSGARVLTADGTGNGDTAADAFMRAILDAAAAYERALIRARTKAAMAVKRARGELVGSVPFGFRLAADGRTLEHNVAERDVVSQIHALRAEGRTHEGIAAELNARGVVARGARWHATTIGRLLRSRSLRAPIAALASRTASSSPPPATTRAPSISPGRSLCAAGLPPKICRPRNVGPCLHDEPWPPTSRAPTRDNFSAAPSWAARD